MQNQSVKMAESPGILQLWYHNVTTLYCTLVQCAYKTVCIACCVASRLARCVQCAWGLTDFHLFERWTANEVARRKERSQVIWRTCQICSGVFIFPSVEWSSVFALTVWCRISSFALLSHNKLGLDPNCSLVSDAQLESHLYFTGGFYRARRRRRKRQRRSLRRRGGTRGILVVILQSQFISPKHTRLLQLIQILFCQSIWLSPWWHNWYNIGTILNRPHRIPCNAGDTSGVAWFASLVLLGNSSHSTLFCKYTSPIQFFALGWKRFDVRLQCVMLQLHFRTNQKQSSTSLPKLGSLESSHWSALSLYVRKVGGQTSGRMSKRQCELTTSVPNVFRCKIENTVNPRYAATIFFVEVSANWLVCAGRLMFFFAYHFEEALSEQTKSVISLVVARHT